MVDRGFLQFVEKSGVSIAANQVEAIDRITSFATCCTRSILRRVVLRTVLAEWKLTPCEDDDIEDTCY
ncbi:unnamed protein product [Aphanomyces euteiches]